MMRTVGDLFKITDGNVTAEIWQYKNDVPVMIYNGLVSHCIDFGILYLPVERIDISLGNLLIYIGDCYGNYN